MTAMKYDSNEERIKFCNEIVPTERYSYRQKIFVTLNTQEFEAKVKSFLSTDTPFAGSKPPLQKASELFKESFIIGEAHADISPKKFLIENIKNMKEHGCEILFMEHLFYDTQEELDKFFETGDISDILMQQLNAMNRHGTSHFYGPTRDISASLWNEHDYIAVLHAARKAGVRIVGVDISTVYETQAIDIGSEQKTNTRIPYMNYTAAKIMQREISSLPPEKKWCGLMGNAHVSTFEDTPGITDIFGVRSVYVFDQQNWKNSDTRCKKVAEFNTESVILGGRDIFKGEAIFKIDPRSSTTSLINSNPATRFRDFLDRNRSHKPLTTKQENLAIQYLASLKIDELCKHFGFNDKEIQHLSSYHFVDKITPVNLSKPKNENDTFCFQIEENHLRAKPYTLYVSKDKLIEFAALQQLEMKQQKAHEHSFSPS
ncbi:hypothetical protein Lsan_0297 [Legionella santicrucis]|uniref:Haem-binding uptake Tiki superfamily ChaN domain-containing protein n=1 Tax=Legionella santicrucis TaxID=45074 RepID=A0A0W0ZFP1_9GAMM|nr:membrane-targeted effector domain-containing toxin [Legionella santicrucis]KTD67638.1 hypothetical protein Lsan_0297 [Legionella santicrucis]